jgi:hypothetical protein
MVENYNDFLMMDDLKPQKKNRKYSNSFMDFRDDINMDDGSKELKDKVTSINKFVEKYQKRLEGYEFVSSLNEVTYTGKVLCGSNCIQKLVSIISPFSENSNLISSGKQEEYFRDKHEVNSVINEILLGDPTVHAENYKTILKMSKNTFKRIGNIVNSSRDLMKGQFGVDSPMQIKEGDL